MAIVQNQNSAETALHRADEDTGIRPSESSGGVVSAPAYLANLPLDVECWGHKTTARIVVNADHFVQFEFYPKDRPPTIFSLFPDDARCLAGNLLAAAEAIDPQTRNRDGTPGHAVSPRGPGASLETGPSRKHHAP